LSCSTNTSKVLGPFLGVLLPLAESGVSTSNVAAAMRVLGTPASSSSSTYLEPAGFMARQRYVCARMRAATVRCS
jgi:hypothetical protein